MLKKIILIAFAVGSIPCYAWEAKTLAESGMRVFGNKALTTAGKSMFTTAGKSMFTTAGKSMFTKEIVSFPAFKGVPTYKDASMPILLMNPPTVNEKPVKIEVSVPQPAPYFLQGNGSQHTMTTKTVDTHLVTYDIQEMYGRLEAIKQAANYGIRSLQAIEMTPALMAMQNKWQRSNEAAYKGYMKQAYPSILKRVLKKDEAQADKMIFLENVAFYSDIMDQINEFFSDMIDLTTQLSQRVNIGEQKISYMQQKFDYLANEIIKLDQLLAIRPWELVQKVQYLQRAEYFLKRLQEGVYPNRLPRPILPLSASVNTFYLGNRDLIMMREYIPLNLRIAVVHEREEVRDMIVSGGKVASRLGYNWKVDSFANPQSFLAKKDLISYDIVIGDFSPYANKYTPLLQKLVDIGNAGTVILSASNQRPDHSYYPTDAERKSNWDNFAKRSMLAGIDGNLQFFPEASLANEYAKNTFMQYSPTQIMHNITCLYGAKGSKE